MKIQPATIQPATVHPATVHPATVQPAMSAPMTNVASPRLLTEEPQKSQTASPQSSAGRPDLRQTFDQFVGETFYGHMLKAMRKTVGKPAYMHGGRGEEVFQQQLDQLIVERMTDSTAAQFTGPMFELFELGRQK